jgi:crotonobetainyl-CoA:carnitine CoA-transferase CaiB-like acyl-CoA transferase
MWRHLMSSSNNYEKLDEIFGTQTEQISTAVVIPPATPIQVPVAYIPTGDDIEDDYQVARQKLNTLIDKSQQALDGMLNVALASDSPRAYEVVGQLIKTTGDTAKDLLDLQARKKKLREQQPVKGNIETQNNIVFAGSTADLLKALKAEKAKIIDHE